MKETKQAQILKLKNERRAIILAHNYQPPFIQDIADLTGDSLELSRQAASTDARVIVFCGVSFMAETAAILNPDKIVLLPNPKAGCPMADMIRPEDLLAVREQYPDVPIVTYVNSTAAVKAESTVCCTSANSLQVVNSFHEGTLYMAPDQNLAKYTSRHTDKKIFHWHGYCPIHHRLSPDEVMTQKGEFPEALFIAHPECRPEVIDLADVVESTSGMLRYVQNSAHQSFIIGTERGILYPMKKANPDKHFIPASKYMVCPDMNKTTLNHVLHALETLEPRISVPESIRMPALNAVQRMLQTR
jgi:quinolinate synthase